MTPDPLTPKQQSVLSFVRRFFAEWGYAPTIAEICDGLGLASTATVHKHLKILVDKGHIDTLRPTFTVCGLTDRPRERRGRVSM